jgi:hypothetical protein
MLAPKRDSRYLSMVVLDLPLTQSFRYEVCDLPTLRCLARERQTRCPQRDYLVNGVSGGFHQ